MVLCYGRMQTFDLAQYLRIVMGNLCDLFRIGHIETTYTD